MAIAILNRRFGLITAVIKEKNNRSQDFKFGAFFLPRVKIMSCLRSIIFSAISDFLPPGLTRITNERRK